MNSITAPADLGLMSAIRNCGPTVVSFPEPSGVTTSRKTSPDLDASVFAATLTEGERAPGLPSALFGDGVNSYAGRRPHTRVIAFVSGFCDDGPTDEADLERIRAEVRGLSATLLVISPRGSWCFGPDDRLFRRVGRVDARDEACAIAFQRFGLAEQNGPEGLRGVFIIDAEDTIRFAHTTAKTMSPGRASQDALLRALVIAANEMERALKGAARPSPDQATTLGLIAGFKQAVGAAPVSQGRVRRSNEANLPGSMAW